MFGDPADYHDFIVESANPERLDDTLQQLPMSHAFVVGRGVPGGIALIEGNPVVRVFGNPSFFKFAVENQGYCKIIRELEKKKDPEWVQGSWDTLYDLKESHNLTDAKISAIRKRAEALAQQRKLDTITPVIVADALVDLDRNPDIDQR